MTSDRDETLKSDIESVREFMRLLYCDGRSIEEVLQPIKGIPLERLELVGRAFRHMKWDEFI